jgi:hypothetical protein
MSARADDSASVERMLMHVCAYSYRIVAIRESSLRPCVLGLKAAPIAEQVRLISAQMVVKSVLTSPVWARVSCNHVCRLGVAVIPGQRVPVHHDGDPGR